MGTGRGQHKANHNRRAAMRKHPKRLAKGQKSAGRPIQHKPRVSKPGSILTALSQDS